MAAYGGRNGERSPEIKYNCYILRFIDWQPERRHRGPGLTGQISRSGPVVGYPKGRTTGSIPASGSEAADVRIVHQSQSHTDSAGNVNRAQGGPE